MQNDTTTYKYVCAIVKDISTGEMTPTSVTDVTPPWYQYFVDNPVLFSGAMALGAAAWAVWNNWRIAKCKSAIDYMQALNACDRWQNSITAMQEFKKSEIKLGAEKNSVNFTTKIVNDDKLILEFSAILAYKGDIRFKKIFENNWSQREQSDKVIATLIQTIEYQINIINHIAAGIESNIYDEVIIKKCLISSFSTFLSVIESSFIFEKVKTDDNYTMLFDMANRWGLLKNC